MASQSEIVQIIQAAMLLGNDMLDVMPQVTMSLIEQTVLTVIARSGTY